MTTAATPSLELDLELPLARFTLRIAFRSSARSLGVFGPSGSGKTSLLELLAGWRRPASGRIVFGGRTWLDTERGFALPARERRVGFVPQDALLFPHLDVRDNVLAGAPAGAPLFARAVDVLELEPLLAQPPASLSGGERQRVALARALCSNPELLLLDEPLGGLDQALRRRILPWLMRVRASFDLPLVFVAHDPAEVQALCEEAIVLEAGRVADHGPARETLRRACAGRPGFDNVLAGIVRAVEGSTAEVVLASGHVFRVPATGCTRGERVHFALDADDVLVAAERIERISARNVLPARVTSVELHAAADTIEARLGADGSGEPLTVALTAAAVKELGLAVESHVHLVVKTQSCRVLGSVPA